jgi:hypothetical protein
VNIQLSLSHDAKGMADSIFWQISRFYTTLCALRSPVCIETTLLVHGTVEFCVQYHGLMHTGEFKLFRGMLANLQSKSWCIRSPHPNMVDEGNSSWWHHLHESSWGPTPMSLYAFNLMQMLSVQRCFRARIIRNIICTFCTFVIPMNPETMYFCFRVLYFQKYKESTKSQ